LKVGIGIRPPPLVGLTTQRPAGMSRMPSPTVRLARLVPVALTDVMGAAVRKDDPHQGDIRWHSHLSVAVQACSASPLRS
jgi:hypothetical protein